MLPNPPAGVSPELSAVVLRCLEKKPERRFPSVRAAREELDGTAAAKRKQEQEARALELRRAEEERVRAEERRKEEEWRRRAEEKRKEEEMRRRAEEQRKQAELEAGRRREEEKRAAEQRRQEEQRGETDEARRQSALRPKIIPAGPKPNYGRRVAIGLIAVGIIAVFIWQMNSRNRTDQLAPKASMSSLGMEFVSIPAGRFAMGCSPGDSQCGGDENPRHEVRISRSFELGKYEVTQGQWVKVMGNNPSNFKGDDRLPVEQVSWNEAQAFIAKLNDLNDGYRYRLPTEVEWEYAARGRTTGPYYGNLDAIAWYDSNSGSKTHPVGQKQPNGFGLYDMVGNVWEWCADWHGESYYGSSPATDPNGPSSGQYRVLRGGSWNYVARYARVSGRGRGSPDGRYNCDGFRVCREPL